jgi:hypothetical protein
MTRVPDSRDVTVWEGSYPLARDDPFFDKARRAGQKYVDEKVRGRLNLADGYLEAMAELRESAPPEGAVLVDELEHRWSNPDALATLYVLSMEVCVRDDEVLIVGDQKLGQRAPSIKVGEAARSLAPRLWVYAGPRGLDEAVITHGSLVLRAVVYGSGRAMLSERTIQQYARSSGARLQVVGTDGVVRWKRRENYWGANLVEDILALVEPHGRS